MTNQTMAGARCTCSSFRTGTVGSFNFDQLVVRYCATRVCPSCTENELRTTLAKCVDLKVIISPKSDQTVSIDWVALSRVKDESNETLYNSILYLLVCMDFLKGRAERPRYVVSSAMKNNNPVFVSGGKAHQLYFRRQEDAESWRQAIGSQQVLMVMEASKVEEIRAARSG